MKIADINLILEANVAAKVLKNPDMTRKLALAFRHDHSLPGNVIAKLGTKPTDEDIVKAWSELLDATLRQNDYMDLSRSGKFDDWLLRQYVNGILDYEDIHGEAGSTLGRWAILSQHRSLEPKDQDFNEFKDLRDLQTAMNNPTYRRALEKFADAALEQKEKRNAQQTIIYEDPRYMINVPYNPGSGYVFNRVTGPIKCTYCTGESSRDHYFASYASRGIIIQIVNKFRTDDDGKFQLHASTDQANNSKQRNNGDRAFADSMPGVMKYVFQGLQQHANEIKEKSKFLTPGGYDIPLEIERLKSKFPIASATEQPPEKLFKITQRSTGKEAQIDALNEKEAKGMIQIKFPQSDIHDFEFEEIDRPKPPPEHQEEPGGEEQGGEELY